MVGMEDDRLSYMGFGQCSRGQLLNFGGGSFEAEILVFFGGGGGKKNQEKGGKDVTADWFFCLKKVI